jgi:hypothetical protein
MNGYGASRRSTSKGLPWAAIFLGALQASALAGCGTVTVLEQPLGARPKEDAKVEAVARQAEAALAQAVEAGWGETQRQGGLAEMLLNGVPPERGAADAVGAYLLRLETAKQGPALAVRRDLRAAEQAVEALSEQLAKALREPEDLPAAREALLPVLERTLIVYRRGAAVLEAAGARLHEGGTEAGLQLAGLDALLDGLAAQADALARLTPP